MCIRGGVTGDIKVSNTNLHNLLKVKYCLKERVLMIMMTATNLIDYLRQHIFQITKSNMWLQAITISERGFRHVNYSQPIVMCGQWCSPRPRVERTEHKSFTFNPLTVEQQEHLCSKYNLELNYNAKCVPHPCLCPQPTSRGVNASSEKSLNSD